MSDIYGLSMLVCETNGETESGKEEIRTIVLLKLQISSDPNLVEKNCLLVCPNNKIWSQSHSDSSLSFMFEREIENIKNKGILGLCMRENGYFFFLNYEDGRNLAVRRLSKFVGSESKAIDILENLSQKAVNFDNYKFIGAFVEEVKERKVKNWGAWS